MPFKKGNTFWKLSSGMFKKGHISYNKGKEMSQEQTEKIRQALKGNKNAKCFIPTEAQIERIITWNKEHIEEKHPHWNKNVGYRGLHKWVQRKLGKAIRCSNGCKNKKLYEWANISGEYKRELSDWHELCRTCNRRDGIKIHSRFEKKHH